MRCWRLRTRSRAWWARTCAAPSAGCPPAANSSPSGPTATWPRMCPACPRSTPWPWARRRCPGCARSTKNTVSRAWPARCKTLPPLPCPCPAQRATRLPTPPPTPPLPGTVQPRRPRPPGTPPARRNPPALPLSGATGDLFPAPAADAPVAGHGADPPASAARQPLVQYESILDWQDFEQWLQRLQQADLVALDTETDSLDEMRAQIVGISLSVQPGAAAYIPLQHSGPDAPAQLPIGQVLARLKPWVEDGRRHKLGQHIKYDRHVFANHGIEVQGYVHDTMLQSYVLEVHKPHNLGSLAERHTGRKGISYEDLCGKGAHQLPFAQVPVDKAAAYSCEDADLTLNVHQTLWPQLQAHDRLRFIYELEIASSEALYRI